MADDKTTKAKTETVQPELPTTAPMKSEDEASLRAQIAQLQHALRLKNEECEAQWRLIEERDAHDKAKAAAEKTEQQGPKLPYALIPVLGEGRRMKAIGHQLTRAETEGLEHGVHFELR